MLVLRSKVMGAVIAPTLILFPLTVNSWSYKWTGKGKLYDQRNQYHVTCRLTKEKRVEPFLGEDSVKCFYTCSDKETMVITTHSDFACEKQIQSARGDQRDWRKRLKY
tara:strand:+ start:126 stop:449 length:324 start_codon:yes stop_codon:yes gene_type:complete